MKCPVDDTVLSITDRQGLEIDWCPTCRGVWLDRGELDKLIDRSLTGAIPASAPDPARKNGRDRSPDRDQGDGRRPKKQKSSMLSELFEF